MNDYIARYVHGSKDSIDLDVIYVIDTMPSFDECKKYCESVNEENINLITIKNGIVSASFKGLPDEVNNALFDTYPLHKQQYPLLVTHKVERDVILKAIRVIRKILSYFTKSQYRTTIKDALRGNLKNKLQTLKNFNYEQIDYGNLSKMDESAIFKSISFQLGQILALFDGVELYTKSDIATYYPELKAFLYRENTEKKVLISYIYRLVKCLENMPIDIISNDVILYKPTNTKYDINKEIKL